jgi:hypothetical protein
MLSATYAECSIFYCYAECRYDECHHDECRGAILLSIVDLRSSFRRPNQGTPTKGEGSIQLTSFY